MNSLIRRSLSMVEEKSVRKLTPLFIKVGAAARLSTAVSRFAQVTRLAVVDPWTVREETSATGILMVLHHLVDKRKYYTVTHVLV